MTATHAKRAEAAVAELGDFGREIEALISRNDAPTGTTSVAERAAETRDKLLELSEDGLELELSVDLRQRYAGFVLAAVRALNRFVNTTDEEARIGYATDALIEIEAVRHVLRDGLDHEPVRTTTPSGSVVLTRADAVAHVERWVPRLTRERQAVILGIDPRDISRWKRDGAASPATRRAELAVEIVGILRHSWTDEGVARWFTRAHPALAERRPVDVIDDEDWEHRLMDAARSGRAQTAT